MSTRVYNIYMYKHKEGYHITYLLCISETADSLTVFARSKQSSKERSYQMSCKDFKVLYDVFINEQNKHVQLDLLTKNDYEILEKAVFAEDL
jgi:hypothetical protein